MDDPEGGPPVMTISAQVTRSPGLLDVLEFPAAIHAATRFAGEPAMQGSAFRAGLQEAIAEEQNLAFPAVFQWLRDWFAGYEEEVVGSAQIPLDVLSVDIHVPHVEGATATFRTVATEQEANSVTVTLFGVGGGAKHAVAFTMEDSIEVTACTRQTYTSPSTWELVEIVAGPDTGIRFPRLVELDRTLSESTTASISDDPCEVATDDTTWWRTFDYREGAVSTGTPKLVIERSDAWFGKVGLQMPKFGIDASVDTEVSRGGSIELEYSLPGGHLYEAHRSGGFPFAWWPPAS
jgi:hypothetical protein